MKKQKKYIGFHIPKKANVEAFFYVISLSIKLLFLKSQPVLDQICYPSIKLISFLKLVNWIKRVGLFVTALIPYLMENIVIITFVLIIVKMEDFVHIPCKKTNRHHQ